MGVSAQWWMNCLKGRVPCRVARTPLRLRRALCSLLLPSCGTGSVTISLRHRCQLGRDRSRVPPGSASAHMWLQLIHSGHADKTPRWTSPCLPDFLGDRPAPPAAFLGCQGVHCTVARCQRAPRRRGRRIPGRASRCRSIGVSDICQNRSPLVVSCEMSASPSQWW
jgi:hypothetical protein